MGSLASIRMIESMRLVFRLLVIGMVAFTVSSGRAENIGIKDKKIGQWTERTVADGSTKVSYYFHGKEPIRSPGLRFSFGDTASGGRLPYWPFRRARGIHGPVEFALPGVIVVPYSSTEHGRSDLVRMRELIQKGESQLSGQDLSWQVTNISQHGASRDDVPYVPIGKDKYDASIINHAQPQDFKDLGSGKTNDAQLQLSVCGSAKDPTVIEYIGRQAGVSVYGALGNYGFSYGNKHYQDPIMWFTPKKGRFDYPSSAERTVIPIFGAAAPGFPEGAWKTVPQLGTGWNLDGNARKAGSEYAKASEQDDAARKAGSKYAAASKEDEEAKKAGKLYDQANQPPVNAGSFTKICETLANRFARGETVSFEQLTEFGNPDKQCTQGGRTRLEWKCQKKDGQDGCFSITLPQGGMSISWSPDSSFQCECDKPRGPSCEQIAQQAQLLIRRSKSTSPYTSVDPYSIGQGRPNTLSGSGDVAYCYDCQYADGSSGSVMLMGIGGGNEFYPHTVKKGNGCY